MRSSPPVCKKGEVRNLVLISTTTGAVKRSFPDADTGVRIVVADRHGGWFVGGGFGCIGGIHAPALAHLHADGELDSSWHPALVSEPDTVSGFAAPGAIVLEGSTLLVGTDVGVEALDASTGRRRWFDRVPGVVALAANEKTVYIGGGFRSIRGTPRNRIAALDLATGRLLAWAPNQTKLPAGLPPLPGHLTPTISALAISGNRLYVGGEGMFFVGEARPPVGAGYPQPSTIVALDTRTGRALPWVPRKTNVRGEKFTGSLAVGDVSAILLVRNEVLTAGHDGWGVSDPSTGRSINWSKSVSALLFSSYKNIVYLAGDCDHGVGIDGRALTNNLAAINVATGRLTSWAPKVARYTCTNSLAASSKQVLLAGSFSESLG